MKRTRLFLLIALIAAVSACTTTRSDLKSPCAGCDDSIQRRINQKA